MAAIETNTRRIVARLKRRGLGERGRDEAVANAAESLADWAEDGDPMPRPRTVAQLRRDPDVRQALADGDVLVFVPLVRQSPPELRRRYA